MSDNYIDKTKEFICEDFRLLNEAIKREDDYNSLKNEIKNVNEYYFYKSSEVVKEIKNRLVTLMGFLLDNEYRNKYPNLHFSGTEIAIKYLENASSFNWDGLNNLFKDEYLKENPNDVVMKNLYNETRYMYINYRTKRLKQENVNGNTLKVEVYVEKCRYDGTYRLGWSEKSKLSKFGKILSVLMGYREFTNANDIFFNQLDEKYFDKVDFFMNGLNSYKIYKNGRVDLNFESEEILYKVVNGLSNMISQCEN